MKLLKSIFITSYMMFSMAAIGYAAWMLSHGGSILGWIGVVLATLPLMGVLGWLMMFKQTARTSARFPLLNLAGALGTGLAAWAWLRRDTGVLPAMLAGSGWMGFVLYAYWYSYLDRSKAKSFSVGARLPAFTVKDVKMVPILSDQLTEKPALLLFYRGNWCPLCIAQIKELVDRQEELASLGVRVALISPQPYAHSVALSEQYDASFDFLIDEGNSAARILGIDDPHGIPMGMQMLGYSSESVLPTLIITDRQGKVIWTDETDNYRIRPDPESYLKHFREQRRGPRMA